MPAARVRIPYGVPTASARLLLRNVSGKGNSGHTPATSSGRTVAGVPAARPRFAPAIDADVPVVPWPAHEDTRQLLASMRLPRLLLVAPGELPPVPLDELEDWMREPADPVDLAARALALQARADHRDPPPPFLDADGLLWVGARWVAITHQQVPVVELLLKHLDRVVTMDAIVAAYLAGGGSDHPPSVRTLVARLSARIQVVGLELVTVRRRGVVLAHARRVR